LTRRHAFDHSEIRPVRVFRCLLSVALSLVLLAGNVAVCEGWAATPEARMACCAEGDHCPMHKDSSSHGSGSELGASQAQADRCCATSERKQSNPSTPTLVTVISSTVLGVGVAVPTPAPALVLSDGWRTVAPIPIAPVPRHVLFSVYLV
jgi:hypothetical protein